MTRKTPKGSMERESDVREDLLNALSDLVAAGVAQESKERKKLAPRGPEWNEGFDSLQFALRHMPLAHLTLSLFWLLLAWDRKNATEKGRLYFASALSFAKNALKEEGV
jgi:hypothetical protein